MHERTVVESAAFLQVPGSFLLLESGAPAMLFDVLGRVANCGFEHVELDVDGLRAENEDASLWMLGFYERGTQADIGTVYGSALGDGLLANEDLERTRCNQVGL